MKPQVSISLLKLQVTAQSLLESLCEEGNDVYFPVFAPDLALGADKQDFIRAPSIGTSVRLRS